MSVKRRVRRLAVLLLVLFLAPAFQLWYYQVFHREWLEGHGSNPRHIEDLSLRGSILDRRGEPLALTSGPSRRYPLGPAAAPLVGYYHPRLGRGGLELAMNRDLAGKARPRTLAEALVISRQGSRRGTDLVLTLDSRLQQKAYNLLDGRRGAIALLRIEDGAVLAAASFPSFDPAELTADWDGLVADPHAPFVERATQGLYPPGSTFKVMVMGQVLAGGQARPDTIFSCPGVLVVNGFQLFDSSASAHGNLSLHEALVVSCNVTFGRLGLKAGLGTIVAWMEDLKLLEAPSGVPGAHPGHPPQPGNDPEVAAAQAGIGQADMLLTPLSMARLAALIARGGEDVEPALVKTQIFAASRRRLMPQEAAAAVARAMADVVSEGTGGAAARAGLAVAGKTGTAENQQGPPHAWFIGFAPVDSPRYAVAVILENQGYGGVHAAPLAGSILAEALQQE